MGAELLPKWWQIAQDAATPETEGVCHMSSKHAWAEIPKFYL